MSYIEPEFGMIMVTVRDKTGTYVNRWKMLEYGTDRQIVNPKSEDGLFNDDIDCNRYWNELQRYGRRVW